MAVAQERLIELQQESETSIKRIYFCTTRVTSCWRRCKKEPKKILIRERERLKEATEEYNEATAKTPANIIKITEAHNNLLEAISEVNAFDNLFLAFDQIAESSDTTISKVNDMITAIKNLETLQGGGTSVGASNTGNAGSVVYWYWWCYKRQVQ